MLEFGRRFIAPISPHRFCKDYLHIDLHLFQAILIVMMNWASNLVFIGSRGIGKSFLSAVFCIVRCILYPGTKICIASSTRSQSINVLEKIMLELKPRSPELAREIDERQSKINGTNAQIVFYNSSYIKVVTASDSARGNRANLLLLDEFRMISKDVIDTVLKKFLTQKRTPPYSNLSKKEKREAYAKEENKTMYLSSAYFVDHWSYRKCKDTCQAMLHENRRQFICGLPYELPLYEGMIDKSSVEDELYESDFNELKFKMEYEAIWYGNTDGAFFDYGIVAKNRRIKMPMLPDKLAAKLGNTQEVRIPPKIQGEIRLLSADIALMSSHRRNNDATAIFINQMMPTRTGRYTSNIVYTESYEGLRTDDQALIIRRLFDEFSCDYLVMDTHGLGLGVYDAIAADMVDQDTGDIYPALSCCNDQEMAERCHVSGADKVVWSVKANQQFNSDCAVRLREGFRSGRVRLLCTEYDGEALMSDIKGYSSLSDSEKIRIKMPYINTTLLIDELTKLQYDGSGSKIRVFERSNMRKDRYSSLSYNYYVAMQLEAKMGRKSGDADISESFAIRAPRPKGRVVRSSNGRERDRRFNVRRSYSGYG